MSTKPADRDGPAPGALERVVTPRAAGLAGLAAIGVVLGGAFVSLSMHPSYSGLRNYVSELAFPKNPGDWVFSLGLVLGGVLLLPFSWRLGGLVAGRHGRRAGWLGLVAAAAMVAVGCFPLTRPVAHFACAFVLFAAAIFATLCAGLGLRERARTAGRPAPLRRIAGALFGLFGFMLLMTAAGFVHTAFAYRHVTSSDPAKVLKELPKHQMVHPGGGWPAFNPAALMEWVFLILAMGLVLAGSVALLRARPATTNDDQGDRS